MATVIKFDGKKRTELTKAVNSTTRDFCELIHSQAIIGCDGLHRAGAGAVLGKKYLGGGLAPHHLGGNNR